MSLPLDVSRDSSFTIIPSFDTNFGRLEVDETIELNFKVTSTIPKVKVICEQETNKKVKEVETKTMSIQTASTKNLKINFKANKGGIVNLVIKVEKLKGNKTYSDKELKVFEQKLQLKYQIKSQMFLSNIDVIPEDEIEIIKEIGKGGEATVYKAKYDDEIVAIKTYKPGYGIEESEKMLHFKDKYIVEYKKSFNREINNQKCFCSMLEYAEHGSLEGKKHFISQPILYKIMEDVCKALKYLHEVKHVIHRDIKPQNILIFNYHEIHKVNAKLTDFGTCDIINNEGNFGRVGTNYFMAPEVVKGDNYTNKCDIYSLGITMLNSFLMMNFNNSISDVIQLNGTYIKTTTYLKSDIKKLITKCCQINPLKRPDINICLNSIQEIRKIIDDKEIFETINVEQKDVRYSLPKFDLLESIKIVVRSIKELNVTNEFIKSLLMLKFEINAEEALSFLQNNYVLENKGDGDYASACYYLKKNDHDLINKAYELIISAASKSHPDAIIYLIDILIDIVDGNITIYDEKYQINEIINNIYDLGIVQNKKYRSPEHSILKINNNTISITNIINIFSILRKYIPVCEFQYGIALLYGIGTAKNIINSEAMFNSFRKSKYCNDSKEVEFYQSYCKYIKNNTEETYKEAYNMLEGCIMNSEKQYYYSYALNNEGVLLYKGLGCEKNINKAFECFEKSMNLTNNYGKFNHAFCLREHKEILTSEFIYEDGKTIMLELANKGLDVAQQLYAFDIFNNYLDSKKYDLLQEAIYWFAQASLQFDYISISNLGICLNKWSKKNNEENQNEEKQNKCKKIAFTLFSIAEKSGCLEAQMNLINCYRYGKGTEKNLEKSKNLCKKALKNSENDEIVDEQLKIKAKCQYLSILKEIHLQKIDIEISEDVKELLETLKKTNNPKAYNELGNIYYDGIIIEKDIKKAIEYYENAGNQNDVDALNNLGKIYQDGDGVQKDIKKAIEYYEKAANQNFSYALFNLGILYRDGDGVKKDIKKSIEYFEKAANKNDLDALYELGNIYYEGDGVQRDIKKGIEYLEKAANKNDLDANFKLGYIYAEEDCIEKDINKAIEYYEKAAKQNQPDALHNLGLIYYEGIVVEKDIEKGIEYLEKSAIQNSLDALYRLGKIYYIGDCVEKDMDKAIRCFENAALQNNPKALNKLGNIYLEGDGVEKDINKAIDCFEKASIQNHRDALNNLGDIYLQGEGVEKNLIKAFQCFKSAAFLNYSYAQFNLGWMYQNGEGVEKDIYKAINYYECAANQNNTDAYFELGKLYLDGICVEKDVNKAIEYFGYAAADDNSEALFELGKIYFNRSDVEKNINIELTRIKEVLKMKIN
ncbi:hypothetical protein QTN25_002440 [Entamoeba marina]